MSLELCWSGTHSQRAANALVLTAKKTSAMKHSAPYGEDHICLVPRHFKQPILIPSLQDNMLHDFSSKPGVHSVYYRRSP